MVFSSRAAYVALLVVLVFPAVARPTFLYVANQGGADILRVDTTTGAQTVVSSGGYLTMPSGIAVASDGSLLVANRYGEDIIRVNPLTGYQSVVSSGGFLRDPMSLVVAPSGIIYVIDPDPLPDGSRVGLLSIDPSNGSQTRLSWGGNFTSPYGIALDQHGDILVADRGWQAGGMYHDGSVIRVDPATGIQTVVSAGGLLVNPDHLAVASNGDILVADHDAYYDGTYAGGVTLVNPVMGGQTAVSYGYFHGGPAGIALDENGNIYVSDNDSGDIYRIDPQTGKQVVVSSGGYLVNPEGLVYVASTPEPSTLVLFTGILGSLGFISWYRRKPPAHRG